MKVIFAGTPPFAACALEALIAAGHEIALVLTRPDRPAGRGMKTAGSAVKLTAQRYGLCLLQPASLNQSELHAQLGAVGADFMVVAAYGMILPPPVLPIPGSGCLNIHASLLPRWRGAAPIERAILAGDHETGITIMQMDPGLDTGAILLARGIAIAPDDTSRTLHDKLASLGAHCIVEALALLEKGKLLARPQDEAGATYAPKIGKEEAEIDWQRDAAYLSRAVRAFNPRPGAYSRLKGTSIKMWRARMAADDSGTAERRPGEILSTGRDGIAVACGRGTLILETMQKAGGKELSAHEFLSGFPLTPGDCFDPRP